MDNPLDNKDEFLDKLVLAISKTPNKFAKLRCSFCGTIFYPSEHLQYTCTYTCYLMSKEIRGGMIPPNAYKDVQKFDEYVIEWQKTMAVLEEKHKKNQEELLEKKKCTTKEEPKKQEPDLKTETDMFNKIFFNFGKRDQK